MDSGFSAASGVQDDTLFGLGRRERAIAKAIKATDACEGRPLLVDAALVDGLPEWHRREDAGSLNADGVEG
jgi:hypothetical protein